MALHPDFPDSPNAILDPDIRWFPADEALRESNPEKLLPPLAAAIHTIEIGLQPSEFSQQRFPMPTTPISSAY